AALHLEPCVSAHLLGSHLVFGFFVKTVGAGCIAHLAPEMCQTSNSAPRLLAFQNFDITVFRRLIAPVLKVEVGPDEPSLVAVINRRDSEQRGMDLCELVKLERSMGLEQVEIARVRQ